MSLRAHVGTRVRLTRSCLRLLFVLGAFGVIDEPAASDAAQLTLTWVDNSAGQAAFSIERKSGTSGTYAEIAQQPAEVVSYVDTAVTAGTAYCYRVRAFNSGGTSAYSNEACGTPGGFFTITVATAGAGSGTVTSTPPGITCGTDCSEPYVSGTVVTLSATPSTGSTFSGWSGAGCSGTVACTLTGNSAVTVTATFVTGSTDTQAPSVPTALMGWVGSTEISLSWTPSTDKVGVTGYRVERCHGAGCTSFVQIAAPAGTTFINTGLTVGTSYSYRVRATDAAGNLSGYSTVISGATASATPTSLTSGDITAPSEEVLAVPPALCAESGGTLKAVPNGDSTGYLCVRSGSP